MENKEDYSVIEEYLNGIDLDDYNIVILTPKRRQRRIDNMKHQKKLANIYNNTRASSAGEVVEKTNHKGEKHYISGNRPKVSKWVKNQCNRKVRRTRGRGNPSTYK